VTSRGYNRAPIRQRRRRKDISMIGRRVLLAAGLASLVALTPGLPTLIAADHGDAPGVRFETRLDINDVYAFQSPNQSGNVVFIMTLSPAARIISPNTFHPTADHDFFVNTNADPDYEFAFNFRFGPPGTGGIQEMHFVGESRISGQRIFDILSSTTQTIALPGGGFIRANESDDPFFFDLIAFRTGLSSLCGGAGGTTGVNFFRGLNVLSIALELPRSLFGTNNIGVWARTFMNGQQFERMARPVINTVFIPAAMKDAFNAANPVNDQALFRDPFTATARALGNTADRANFLADFLLPDILTLDTSSTAAFPNGRRLQDDVIDTALNLVSNGAITRDCVAGDTTFSNNFPYWAPPNP
jgi:hypothetical protein